MNHSDRVRKERRVRIWRIVLIGAGVILIAAGILNQSLRDVLYKAINICAECIGLG
ncbi:MAG: hypothetical protein IJ106_08950 [Parasporobacterium sp.]|nr:hypothetical protein [Parasporobacterium sp.]